MNLTHRNKIKSVLSGLLFLILSFTLYSQAVPTTNYFKLDNGLKVYLYKKTPLPLLHIVCAVNIGSKDESDETDGLIHLLEHYILFRGSESRSGTEIGRDIRSHGAYFNAHTGHDIALFEISLPSEYGDFALELHREILFDLKISQEELDKEKEVILEELNQLEDDPLRLATSLVYQNLFTGHAYQRSVYGKPEIIKNATAEQLTDFYSGYFHPSNCSLAVVGDMELVQIESKIKEIFGTIKEGTPSEKEFKMAEPLQDTIEIERQLDVNMAYLVIGMTGPDYNSPDRYAADLITQILGRGFNPLMNTALYGQRGIRIHSLHMIYNAHKYGGSFLVQITIDPDNLKSIRRSSVDFLKSTRNLRMSKDDYFGEQKFHALDHLEGAKNSIKFTYYQSQEYGLNIAASLARFMLLNEIPERGNYLEQMEGLSSSDLRKTAADYLSRGRYVLVSIVPKEKK
ncbi:MAG: insulinase family protein [Candidatus Aminicenantes bacterium]|nr:insulinase family protein [Candidatus Aminicenantes bacterium]